MNTKLLIQLYSENNIAEANKLLESVLLEKIELALEAKRHQLFSEGDIKVNNKKKKNNLAVRAGRTVGGISAKHSGRTLFRTMQPSQLKSILATEEEILEAKPMTNKDVHKILSDAGFIKDRQKGSHIVYKHPTGKTQTVPFHKSNPVSSGVVRQIFSTINSTKLQEQYRPVGSHTAHTKGLKHHLRFVHPIQKQRKNRRFYKSLHNRLDRK